MIMTQEWKTCEWIRFSDNRTNLKNKLDALRVGKYLAVCGTVNTGFRIFQVYGGLPIADVLMVTVEDAVQIAKRIAESYKEYLMVWEVYPDWDVIGIARLSIPDGEAVYNTLMKLSNQRITLEDYVKKLSEEKCLISLTS